MKTLAERQGVDVDTALKRLKNLQRRSGVELLFRLSDGRRAPWYTTAGLLLQADPRWLEEHEILRSDVDALKEWKLKATAEITRLRARLRRVEEGWIEG